MVLETSGSRTIIRICSISALNFPLDSGIEDYGANNECFNLDPVFGGASRTLLLSSRHSKGHSGIPSWRVISTNES